MGSLQGKKLLILGGNAISSTIVNAARSMGVYSIVADWYDTNRSPAKLVADEYWNEDIFQTKRIVQLIRDNNVEGVITGFTDSYLLQYNEICESAGLPCYATKEVFKKTLDKAIFKQLCKDNDVPVVPEYDVESFLSDDILNVGKILIKPVDNSGSRGIITCETPSEFNKCMDYALSFSEKKQVVIEKYMDMDTFSVSYTIQDGLISMSTMNDRIVHKAPNAGAVTNGGIYPSKYIDSYMDKMDKKVRKMYENLGVQNGVLFIQGFTNGTEFFFYEMGYRLSGGCHFLFTDHQNHSSSVKQLIHFALTGNMADYRIIDRDNPKFKDLCFEWNILGKEGKIVKIEGDDILKKMPGVISWSLDKSIGDEIGKDGTTAQKIAGLHMVVKNKAELVEILNYIYQNFVVLDERGNSLILNTVNENFK